MIRQEELVWFARTCSGAFGRRLLNWRMPPGSFPATLSLAGPRNLLEDTMIANTDVFADFLTSMQREGRPAAAGS
jgi:hypothetical protein